ncbi:MAG: 5-formyltetrahydrofolate cyclo-ligase, partial [Acidobacteriota bacterium]|nr:5-formyltetrahydrofolate cyclo-ligase [Acidobacteriota bacterium]
SLDFVLVPLLCFDRRGHRVGYGGGYYDRFLAKVRPDCLKIGLSFFGPVDEIEDVHEGDIRLDYCVMPERIYDFSLTNDH